MTPGMAAKFRDRHVPVDGLFDRARVALEACIMRSEAQGGLSRQDVERVIDNWHLGECPADTCDGSRVCCDRAGLTALVATLAEDM